MPVLPATLLLNNLVARSPIANSSAQAANATTNALHVVCAWPVSGQYGPGSRVLYYVLVAACVVARKEEWLRNACLAAALLFPAVAAIHGIVLAAVHVDGAVDMDVYGAFQLCSIGILAAPVTVRLSRTYFYDPGRNTIFLWTGLILAGLLSLTVEFYRSTTSTCKSGNPIPRRPSDFDYGNLCGLRCSIEDGPHSPMRRGSANNIYVIPAPDNLTFDMATLLAAACCIPAILSLVSMWNKIVEINWRKRSVHGEQDQGIDEVIEGTNGATIRKMNGVNSMIRTVLSGIEIPIFSAAVLAILIIGERNFFSHQVRYQTEPMASVGQWAPVAGTVFAAVGSLYMLLTAQKLPSPGPVIHHCDCSHPPEGGEDYPTVRLTPSRGHSPGNRDHPPSTIDNSRSSRGTRSIRDEDESPSLKDDAGNRRKVAKLLASVTNYFSNAAHDDVSEFKQGPAVDYPQIPGEGLRNPDLTQTQTRYNLPRDADGNITPSLRKSNSMGSFTSVASRVGGEGSSTKRLSPELHNLASASSANSPGSHKVERRDTLEVPTLAHHAPARSEHRSSSSINSIVS